MKIKKTKMTEAVENAKLTLVEDADGIDSTGSVAEIADDVQDELAQTTDGEVTLSDTAAEKVAKEVKPVADEVKPQETVIIPKEKPLGVKNRITEKLDKALAIAKRNKRRGERTECNVLIVGLPGSGKTASIND
jgi:signal recognition particle GTPase